MVVDEVVVGVGDPEAGRRLVRVQQTPASPCLHDQVLVDVVLRLYGVLDEDRVAHHVVSHVLRESQIVCAVQGEGSIVGLVDSEAFCIRLVDRPYHVKVKRVPTKFEGLSRIGQLDIGEPSCQGVVAGRVQEDVGTVLGCAGRLWVPSEDDIPRKQADLSPHVDKLGAARPHLLRRREVLELERPIQRDGRLRGSRPIDRNNCPLFGLSALVARRGDGYLLSWLPVYGLLQSDCLLTRSGSTLEHSPCGRPLGSVHVESTEPHAEYLVTVDR